MIVKQKMNGGINIKELLKLEFKGWKKIELFWLVIATLIITSLSFYWGESTIGIISAVTGVVCVILTGKGKLGCFVFGLVNCITYAYMAYQAKFYGDVIENMFYYIPMQFVGFALWKKNINTETAEVIARRLNLKQVFIYIIGIIVGTCLYAEILKLLGGNLPYLDSVTNIMSIAAMFLSVKRYAEQWILWIIIDVITVVMWAIAFIQHQESLATLLMWIVYLVNAIIMFIHWYKSSEKDVGVSV